MYKMLTEFEKKIAGFIKENRLFHLADKILIAISGGADSIALLHTLYALKRDGLISAELLCAHINHQLRGDDSDGDQDFVLDETKKLRLSLTTSTVDVLGFADKEKLSIETAARELRIGALTEIAKANNCQLIVTAHHKNDNAETLIQRLARGTAFRGLAGIWPVRSFSQGVNIARPLLDVTKEEIIEYLRHKDIEWREDHTNYDCKYRRNFIRHRLLPELQKDAKGSLVEQLSALACRAKSFYRLICDSAEKAWPLLADRDGEETIFDLKKFRLQPKPVQTELVRQALSSAGCGERDLTGYHYETILRLAEHYVGGKEIHLPDGFIVRTEYGKLIFSRASGDRQLEVPTTKEIVITVPGQTRFADLIIDAAVHKVENCDLKNFLLKKTRFIEWFDLDKLKGPLRIRLRLPGDKFRPLSMQKEQRVGKFLTAQRVPSEIRKKTMIIADGEKTIWLWPIRACESTKITNTTRNILQLQIVSRTDGH